MSVNLAHLAQSLRDLANESNVEEAAITAAGLISEACSGAFADEGSQDEGAVYLLVLQEQTFLHMHPVLSICCEHPLPHACART